MYAKKILMKTVSIFIAGSVELETQRKLLKAMANDLNVEFMRKGVQVLMFSHEILQDNQQAYDKCITEDSDYIFFILDGSIGQKTNQEFNLALNAYDRQGKPKILVFSHIVKSPTEDVVRLQGKLEATTGGGYFVPYTNDTDLGYQAEKRLRRILKERMEETEAGGQIDAHTQKVPQNEDNTLAAEVRRTATRMSRRKTLTAIATAILILAVIGGLAFNFGTFRAHQSASRQSIIMAGGASAMNHIIKKCGFDPETHPDYFYLHMPSGVAWQLLTEEVISNSNNSSQRYTPVCVSATVATDSSFLSNMISSSKFTANASVIAFDMGVDPMVVYVQRCPYINRKLGSEISDGCISVDRLAKFIDSSKDSVNIMPTSPRSGTRMEYQQYLAPYGTDLTGLDIIFSLISDGAHLTRNGKPYMVLGSASYYPEVFDNATFRNRHQTAALTLVDTAGQPIAKPVMLYCLATQSGEENEMCFPESTKKLLRELHLDTIPNFGDLLNDPTFKRFNPDSVILTPADLYRITRQ